MTLVPWGQNIATMLQLLPWHRYYDINLTAANVLVNMCNNTGVMTLMPWHGRHEIGAIIFRLLHWWCDLGSMTFDLMTSVSWRWFHDIGSMTLMPWLECNTYMLCDWLVGMLSVCTFKYNSQRGYMTGIYSLRSDMVLVSFFVVVFGSSNI